MPRVTKPFSGAGARQRPCANHEPTSNQRPDPRPVPSGFLRCSPITFARSSPRTIGHNFVKSRAGVDNKTSEGQARYKMREDHAGAVIKPKKSQKQRKSEKLTTKRGRKHPYSNRELDKPEIRSAVST